MSRKLQLIFNNDVEVCKNHTFGSFWLKTNKLMRHHFHVELNCICQAQNQNQNNALFM